MVVYRSCQFCGIIRFTGAQFPWLPTDFKPQQKYTIYRMFPCTDKYPHNYIPPKNSRISTNPWKLYPPKHSKISTIHENWAQRILDSAAIHCGLTQVFCKSGIVHSELNLINVLLAYTKFEELMMHWLLQTDRFPPF